MAFDHTVKGQAFRKRSGWQDYFVVMISDSTRTLIRFLLIQLLNVSFPYRGVLLVSREVPVKHLNCQYVKHIGRSDRCVVPADSSVYTSDEQWRQNEVYGVCSVQNMEQKTSRSCEMGWLFWARCVLILRDPVEVIRLHWHLLSIQGLKFPGIPSLSEEPGKIYLLDLLHPKPTPVELQIMGNLDLHSFNPHGISVYTDDTGDVQWNNTSFPRLGFLLFIFMRTAFFSPRFLIQNYWNKMLKWWKNRMHPSHKLDWFKSRQFVITPFL